MGPSCALHCSRLIFVTSCILFLILSCLGDLESGLQGSEARAYLFFTSVPQHWAQSSVRGRYSWCAQGVPPTVLLFVVLWVVWHKKEGEVLRVVGRVMTPDPAVLGISGSEMKFCPRIQCGQTTGTDSASIKPTETNVWSGVPVCLLNEQANPPGAHGSPSSRNFYSGYLLLANKPCQSPVASNNRHVCS